MCWHRLVHFVKYCPKVFTTPLQQWGFRQFLPFSWTTLRIKHCRYPIDVMGVADTFGQALLKDNSKMLHNTTLCTVCMDKQRSLWLSHISNGFSEADLERFQVYACVLYTCKAKVKFSHHYLHTTGIYQVKITRGGKIHVPNFFCNYLWPDKYVDLFFLTCSSVFLNSKCQ